MKTLFKVLVATFVFLFMCGLFTETRLPGEVVGRHARVSADTSSEVAGTQIAVVANASSSAEQAEPAVQQDVGDQSETRLAQQVGPLDVHVGDVRWRIVSAEVLGQKLESASGFFEPLTTNGKLLRVTVELENQSNDMLTYPTPEAEPTAVEASDFGLRVLDRSSQYTDWSWQVTLRNPTNETKKTYLEIQLLDADNFVLDCTNEIVKLEPFEERLVSNTAMTANHLFDETKRHILEIR